MAEERPVQKKLMMALICLIVGSLGIHRFIMGYKNWWLMLITLGGCGIWTLYDLIMILMDKMPMADGRQLEN